MQPVEHGKEPRNTTGGCNKEPSNEHKPPGQPFGRRTFLAITGGAWSKGQPWESTRRGKVSLQWNRSQDLLWSPYKGQREIVSAIVFNTSSLIIVFHWNTLVYLLICLYPDLLRDYWDFGAQWLSQPFSSMWHFIVTFHFGGKNDKEWWCFIIAFACSTQCINISLLLLQ